MPVRTWSWTDSSPVIEPGDSGTHRSEDAADAARRRNLDDLDGSGQLRRRSKGSGRGPSAACTLRKMRSVGQGEESASGLGESVDAAARVVPDGGEPFDATIPAMQQGPVYAAHLPVIGATLPGWIKSGLLGGESVVIDWAGGRGRGPRRGYVFRRRFRGNVGGLLGQGRGGGAGSGTG